MKTHPEALGSCMLVGEADKSEVPGSDGLPLVTVVGRADGQLDFADRPELQRNRGREPDVEKSERFPRSEKVRKSITS